MPIKFRASVSAPQDRWIQEQAWSSILRIYRDGEIFRWLPKSKKSVVCPYESIMTAMRRRWRKRFGALDAGFAMFSALRLGPELERGSYSMAAFTMAEPERRQKVDTIRLIIAVRVAD